MGPKMQEIELKYNIEDSVVTCALPYNKADYQKAEEPPKEPESAEDACVRSVPSTSEDSEEVDPLRVSTRARFSYELDRYSKNAMLIFEGNASDVAFEYGEEDTPPQDDDMSMKFKRTFEKFRFEVNVYRNLTDEEIASTCERFFHQDFTDYGCVAVMMLAKTRDGVVESSHTPNSEHGVMRYILDLTPPTLQDKPKIFIVQFKTLEERYEEQGVKFTHPHLKREDPPARRVFVSGGQLPSEDFYVIPRARVWSAIPQDYLEFRLTVPIVSSPARGRRSRVHCPLKYIYEKINSVGDQTDLLTILIDSRNEYGRTAEFCSLDVAPRLYLTLTKELRLVRTPEP